MTPAQTCPPDGTRGARARGAWHPAAVPSDAPLTALPSGTRSALHARLREAVDEDRVLTIHGAHGLGKTHAARALCSALRDAGREVMWLEGAAEAAAMRALATLGERTPVVFLDGCDGWIDRAAEAVRGALASGTRARFVVTASERLGLREERIVEVPPLDAHEGRALFLEISRRVRGDAPADARELAAIDSLVAALEGAPLAIELMARQTDLHAPETLLRAEPAPGALFRSELRDPPAAALLAGLERLARVAPEERAALAACAAFAGGFEIDAFGAVAGLADDDAARALRALSGRSWLRPIDGRRFALSRLVRAALLRDPADLDALASATTRHATHYAALAASLAPAAQAGEERALAWLRAERENLLEVARRGLAAPPRAPRALGHRALVALEPVCAPGRSPDGALEDPPGGFSELIELALARAPAATEGSVELEEDVRWLHGRLRLARGDAAGAERDFVECLRVGAPRARARASADLAVARVRLGHVHDAEQAFEEARAALEELGEHALATMAAASLGNVQLELGRAEEARRTLDGVSKRARRAGLQRVEALAANGHGLAAAALGMHSEARASLERAVALLERLDDPRNLAGAVGNLGLLLAEIGADAEARGVLARAAALAEAVGAAEMVARAEGFAACVAWSRGSVPEARAGLRAAVARLEPLGTAVRVHFDAALAVVDAIALGPEQSRGRLEALRALALERPLTRALVALHAAAFDVIDALDQAWRGDARPAVAAHAAFERQLGELLETLSHSMEGRTLVRIARQELRAPIVVGPAGAEGRPRAPDYLLSADAIEVDGCAHDLSRRPSARAILHRLVRERVERPGTPLPVSALVEAGWPGERMLASAAANRVRVAVSGLRANGLDRVIAFARGGYLLDPALAVGLAPALTPDLVGAEAGA